MIKITQKKKKEGREKKDKKKITFRLERGKKKTNYASFMLDSLV